MSNIVIAEPRTVVIKNVTLNYAKLAKPVSPFGTEQYEVQIATSNPETISQMKEAGLNVKEKDGMSVAGLKRKATRADGSPNGAPKVFNGQLSELTEEEVSKMGNGSTGSVKIFQYPYDAGGRKGTASSLTAIQVTNYIKYEGGVTDGFDLEVSEPSISEDSSASF